MSTITPASGSATLIDVAKIAGVSPITVSRALNQPQLVRPDTLAKVQAAVQQTGYVKNMMAGALASNRSKLVALVLPTIANPIFAETVQAASDELTAGGYQLLLGLAGYEAWREELLVETILSRRPDGIILTGTLHTDNTRKQLQNANIPIVETWDMTSSPIDMLVGFSHEEIGHAIAQHLVEQGYRRIAILTVDDPRGARRFQGLMAALAKHGVTVVGTESMPVPATFQLGREGAARLLDRHKGLDMIVASSDTLAHGALTEAASRGLRTPGDLGIMGFGDLELASHTSPPLSTVRVDGAQIGKLAARAILDRIAGAPAAAPRITDTGFQLIHRETT
jgi:LacI family gluconate utilization system Gnt-I transcriptional repressor